MINKNSVESLKRCELLTHLELTHKDYLEELSEYQKTVNSIVFDDEEDHKFDETIIVLEKAAKDKGIQMNPIFRKGIQALRTVNKEIAISMSGKHGEELVERSLQFVTRPNYRFRNVYVCDEEQETELDNVILTEVGFMILEVKNIKTDVTISKEGRLLYSNYECYRDVSICEKMQRKRDLLRKELEKEIEKRGLQIPVRIDSLIVFSFPKYMHPVITDHCGQEKYCTRGKLQFIMDSLVGEELYSEKDMITLDTIMKELATHQKLFRLEWDYEPIKADIISALELFVEDEKELAAVKGDEVVEQKSVITKVVPIRKKKQNSGRAAAVLGSVASFAVISALTWFMTGTVFRSA